MTSSKSHFDAVIVGSGAGGGIAAFVLAKAGFDVLVVEKGPWLTGEDYGDDELKFGDRRFIDQDPLIEPRTFRNSSDEVEDHVFVGRVLPVSRCVGGGSVHYGAVSFRFRPEDFSALDAWGPLEGADLVNWPFGYEAVRPYFNRLEALIGVAGGDTSGAPLAGEWRADPYPMGGHPPNYGARLFEQAAGSLGLHPVATPVAINNGTYAFTDPDADAYPLNADRTITRNGCSYCGFCSNHGCPIDAKGDTRVTALELARRTGRCEIRADCHVFEVQHGLSAGQVKATGVAYLDPDGVAQQVTADVVVLAASTVETPRLVLLSDLPRDRINHDLVGRYLMVHHFPGGIGFFDERVDYYRGFWSMRCLDDFYLGDPRSGQRIFGLGNIQTIGPSSGYGLMAGGMISTAKVAGWGRAHKERMRTLFGHTQWLGMIGQDPPVVTNTVDLDPSVADVYGLPVARITYTHHRNDYEVAPYAMAQIEQILLAMGAKSVEGVPAVVPFSATTGVPQGEQGGHRAGPGRGVPDPIGGLVNHQMGTMRMGDDPATSVVDAHGRMWGTENLFVADGSLLPTSGGYNPTLTIQAVAWRIAQEGIVAGA